LVKECFGGGILNEEQKIFFMMIDDLDYYTNNTIYKNADRPIGQCPIGFGHMSSCPIGSFGQCPNPTMSKCPFGQLDICPIG
jgi:hypothetical protein